MIDSKRSGAVVTCLVVVVVVVVVTVVSGDVKCQQMRGECRVVTQETEGVFSRNISCYCKHGEEVSHYLEQLGKANCMYAHGPHVHTSVVYIVGCSVFSQVFPESLLATCRNSSHMELFVEGSRRLTLASPASPTPAPNTITATFLHSIISGIPEGVVGGVGVRANVSMEGCEVGVLESRAFSGYAPDARVTISFRNTTILTVKQKAFDLPPSAQLKVQGGQVMKFERQSYSGGSELILDGVRVANLLQSAINIYGLKKLNVTNCTVAAVYFQALERYPPTYVRNITVGDWVEEGSEAIFSDNRFVQGNGQAFAGLCSIARLRWHNNTMLATSDMPLRLQSPGCSTQRDWPVVFSSNSISCEQCTNFTNPDKQTCALFESSYCISCEKPLDGCNEPVLNYVTTKCRFSHPDIARALSDTCDATTRTSKALKSQGSGLCASLAPLVFCVAVAASLVYQ